MNGDETGVVLSQRDSKLKVVVSRKMRGAADRTTSGSRVNTTFLNYVALHLHDGEATTHAIPPLIIGKGKTTTTRFANSVYDPARIHRSKRKGAAAAIYPPNVTPAPTTWKPTFTHTENSFVDSKCFLAHMKQCVIPFLESKGWVGANAPQVLMQLDGHVSHHSKAFYELMLAHPNITVFYTVPHLTHKLQVCDANVFKVFKRVISASINAWFAFDNTISPQDIPWIAYEAWKQSTTPAVILSAFKNVGLYPFDPDVVLCSDEMPNPEVGYDELVPAVKQKLAAEAARGVPSPDDLNDEAEARLLQADEEVARANAARAARLRLYPFTATVSRSNRHTHKLITDPKKRDQQNRLVEHPGAKTWFPPRAMLHDSDLDGNELFDSFMRMQQRAELDIPSSNAKMGQHSDVFDMEDGRRVHAARSAKAEAAEAKKLARKATKAPTKAAVQQQLKQAREQITQLTRERDEALAAHAALLLSLSQSPPSSSSSSASSRPGGVPRATRRTEAKRTASSASVGAAATRHAPVPGVKAPVIVVESGKRSELPPASKVTRYTRRRTK